ncbi:hypothetical protein N665_0668s0013 [Sinapis alba]|nr:hypothetical protein N665_0668s0013 [Sinapis alba]
MNERKVRKVPDLAENFINVASSLLKEKHHGVLITRVQLCYELCTINDEALEFFRKKCTEGLIQTLRDITNSAYQPEYDVAGITDPFLHIRLLRLLRVLGLEWEVNREVNRTASETLTIPEIISIPLWVKLKNIPTTLYSIFGIEWIASGLGEPMLSYKPWLDPTMLGEAKVMVEVELDKPFPQKVVAWDKQGNYSLVDVEYPWLPTPCEKCGQIGHKQKRCLSISGQKKTTAHIGNNDPAAAETAPSVDLAATRKETTGSSDLAHDNLLDQVTSPDDQLKNRNEQFMIDNVSHAAADDLASLAAISELENIYAPPIIVCMNEPTESPLLETAPLSNNDVLKVVPKGTSSVEVFGLGSNKFASLVTSDGEEEQLDLDDSVDLLTPFGKRLLRERPVKPSAKAMEIQLQTTSRGRGNRGRGNRGRNR